jgi:hypothetical protein
MRKLFIKLSVILTSLLGGCAMPQNDDAAARVTDARDTPLAEFLARHAITLRIGSEKLPPGPDVLRRVPEAVGRANESRRFVDLPDDLNAELLDAEKVEAFLAALPTLGDDVTAALAGRVLYLNAPNLRLGIASPYFAAALAAGYKLKVPAVQPGAIVQPSLTASIDPQALLPRSAAARRATEEYNARVRELERAVEQIDTDRDPDKYAEAAAELGRAKYRRFQAASVWRGLATAVYSANSEDPATAAAWREASAAAERYVAPPR